MSYSQEPNETAPTSLPSIILILQSLEDPRVKRTRKHHLTDILFISLCAVICGCESFDDMEKFGIAKKEWFRRYLELPNGIPSHDTFNRVYQLLVRLYEADADAFFIAPLPASLKERSLLTPRLAAEIATNRFCDHQPYYRQEQHFLMRQGVHLPRNTMSQWLSDLSKDYLSGIYSSMHEEMLSETYLQADETPIQYLDPGGGKINQGYLWTLSHPDQTSEDGRGDILYQWHASRATTCLVSLLQITQNTSAASCNVTVIALTKATRSREKTSHSSVAGHT